MGIMRVGDFACDLHSPVAPDSVFRTDGEEIEQDLPSFCGWPVHLVGDYPAALRRWNEDPLLEGVPEADYFIEAEKGRALWFDFRSNSSLPKDVAVILSMQGVNTVSGLSSTEFDLRQFERTCPFHSAPFDMEERDGKLRRKCQHCGGRVWPPQNYLASTAPEKFWIDGYPVFENERWNVRNFYFDDPSRSVAAHLLGEKRFFSFTLLFFRSRMLKAASAIRRPRVYEDEGGEVFRDSDSATRGGPSLEVGAGALIRQEIGEDPYRLSHWELNPSGIIRIYYAIGDDFQSLINC